MDKNNIITSMNNLKVQPTKGRVQEVGDEGDVEDFSRMLEAAKSDDTAYEEIYSDKKEKEKAEEQKRLKRTDVHKDSLLKSTKGHIYKLGMKDPDALSLSQKKLLGMEALEKRGEKSGEVPFPESSHDTQRRREISSLTEGKKRVSQERTVKMEVALGAKSEVSYDKELESRKTLAETQEAERKVKREEIIKQIIQHVELRNLGNKTELALKLNPEFLGEMRLRLLFGDNQVTAEFDTVSPLVRDAIEATQNELINALKAKGLKAGRIQVNLVEEVM